MIFKKVDHPTHPKATTGERKKTVVVKEPIKKKEISKNITKSYASGSTESTGEVRKCYHNGFKGTDSAQSMIQYACEVSNYDIDFLLTINSENGGRDMNRASDLIGKNGYRDYGLCQINKGYHPEIVNDKRFYTDYKRHIEQCWKLYSGGTRFYGFDVRYKRSRGLVLIGDKLF